MAQNRKAKGPGFYYFSRGQLAILGVGFTVTSVVIFSLGILIGQGIEERKLLKREREEPIAKIPIRPLPQGSSSATATPAEQKMTFYDTLTKTPPRKEAKAAGKNKGVKAKGKAVKAEGKGKEAKEKASPRTRKQRRVWSVQVKALQKRSDAQSLAKRLKTKGYDAYVVSTKVRGRTWYRVRVGHLATQGQAKRLLETLKKKEKYTKAIVTREG